ncbi:DUF3769 domain-containing protein [Vulcanococcus limneticus]|uniref:DUF3769 domain-containing protein n=1 Tax=Vulcanococcus limneticus TaxID=2170428 RepID=UPI00398BDF83
MGVTSLIGLAPARASEAPTVRGVQPASGDDSPGDASSLQIAAEPSQSPIQASSGADTPASPPSGGSAPATAGAAAPPAPASPPRLIPATPAQSPPLELQVRADQQGFDLLQNRFVATGSVQALLSGGRLLADRLEYDPTTRTVYASGSVRFQRGNQYLQASRLRYSLIQSSGELEEVYGVLDLDTTSFDLNPEQPPSAALLPLSYWERPLLPETSRLAVAPDSTAQAALLASLEANPLGAPAAAPGAASPLPTRLGSGQEPGGGGALDVSGVPQALPSDRWRMPPMALSPAAQTMACPPPLPAIPNWHPYPWAATVWAGQMIDTNFGDTFRFKGRLRPEYLVGVGLNRRLMQAGPLALEIDTTFTGHRAARQAGGEFNQAVPFADTPAQSFGEITAGLGLRAWLQPWLSVGFVEGVSLNTAVSNYEKTYRENYTQFLNYLGFEVEALVAPEWSLVGRIHHRSGAYGTYSGVSEGSNAYLLGLRHRFGSAPDPRPKVAMAPPLGCPDPGRPLRQRVRPLEERLNAVAMGKPGQGSGEASGQTGTAPGSTSGAAKLSPRQQEELRRQAIAATVDQRVGNLQFQQSFSAERRRVTGSNTDFDQPDEVNVYGAVRPAQLQTLKTSNNKKLVTGTISRWRFQANTIAITPDGWTTDRAALTNDPYTPAQAWVDAEGVVARIEPNGDTVVEAKRNQLILEDRLPIPLQRNQRFQKERQVENRWVLGSDGEDRDGFYLGYDLKPIQLGKRGSLALQPQFMVRRALDGTTDSYPLPGEPVGSSSTSQPTRIGDLFGLLARLDATVLGLDASANLDISTFDPSNFANGMRSWGELKRPLRLPLVGDTTARLFGAYRFRSWNGTLGEQDVYSAYGVSLEQRGVLPNWGRLSSNYYWRAGVGNFQGDEFQTTDLASLWRGSVYASLNASLPLWTGKPLPPGPEAANRYTAVPVVPGLTLNVNTTATLAYYGDGTNQNTLSLSGGPTLTLGHFSKPFLDFTQFTITGGGTLRQGVSPLSFDRAVDLGTLGIGLTQQLVGPLVFSGGIGLNVDPSSPDYGESTGSYVELRWQRRAYELSVYYSPYEQLGGVRVKLNDFNFSGTGVPFVPYEPGAVDAMVRRRGF